MVEWQDFRLTNTHSLKIVYLIEFWIFLKIWRLILNNSEEQIEFKFSEIEGIYFWFSLNRKKTFPTNQRQILKCKNPCGLLVSRHVVVTSLLTKTHPENY